LQSFPTKSPPMLNAKIPSSEPSFQLSIHSVFSFTKKALP
jgi:hypothetical protein